ncbi:hypothetical protein ACH3XW_6560 [Acanthocheilonema viteae]
MRSEVRTTVIAWVIMIGMLAAAGIISYVNIKRRKKKMDEIKTDQELMDANVNPKLHQKLMSTRSRHRKERSSLPTNSRRIRFNKFQSSDQQGDNVSDEKK